MGLILRLLGAPALPFARLWPSKPRSDPKAHFRRSGDATGLTTPRLEHRCRCVLRSRGMSDYLLRDLGL